MQLLQLPVVKFKERFPPGILVETHNGFPVPEGTIRFSCNATPFVTASCSVEEKAPGQTERAVQVALPADWPQSAVAAEMYAVLVAGYVLARCDEDGRPHIPGSVTLVADCEAVCRAGGWNHFQHINEKFIFANCWEDFAGGTTAG